jgi:hypothetical protein
LRLVLPFFLSPMITFVGRGANLALGELTTCLTLVYSLCLCEADW